MPYLCSHVFKITLKTIFMQATKFNPGDKGFALISAQTFLIVGVTVNAVSASEVGTAPETVTNSCTDELGNSQTLNDTQVFTTPQEVADALVTAYTAAHPAPVAETIEASTTDTTVSTTTADAGSGSVDATGSVSGAVDATAAGAGTNA
jgi:hypothetical protein